METEADPPITPAWTLQDRLVKSRTNADLTQPEIADALDMSIRQIWRYENGEHAPSRRTLIAWAVVTKVDLDWLIGLKPGPSEPASLERRRSSRHTPGGTGRYHAIPRLITLLAA